MQFKRLILCVACVLFTTSSAASESSQGLSQIEKQAIEAYADKDYLSAFELFVPLAKQGSVFAQFGLAKMYRFGQGIEVDYAKAVEYYQAAAGQSYGVAQSHLGEMYERGLGVEQNLSTAKSWYQIACANACSEGCLNMQRLNQAEAS